MKNLVAIDTSAIIWDNNDFENNKHHYYDLAKKMNVLFEELPKEDINILLRSELQEEMMVFLFSELPKEFYFVGLSVSSFFDRITGKLITYPNDVLDDLESLPNQVKKYFNPNTQNEVKYLLSKMHSEKCKPSYITYEYLWNNNDSLKTIVDEKEKEHNTIIADKGNDLQQYIDSITPRFEHNPKHNCKQNNSKEYWLEHKDEIAKFKSRLSCYNGKDNFEPQRILDERYPDVIDDCYYGWDNNNEVYVVFRRTNSNIFHAHDEYDINEIPNKVKKHFNIWKYRWHH